MNNKQLIEYCGSLTQKQELERTPSFLQELEVIKTALVAYRMGLEGEDFEVEVILRDNLLKEIPEHLHILVGQMALIKSREAEASVRDYLFKGVTKLLKEYKNYFKPHDIK